MCFANIRAIVDDSARFAGGAPDAEHPASRFLPDAAFPRVASPSSSPFPTGLTTRERDDPIPDVPPASPPPPPTRLATGAVSAAVSTASAFAFASAFTSASVFASAFAFAFAAFANKPATPVFAARLRCAAAQSSATFSPPPSPTPPR